MQLPSKLLLFHNNLISLNCLIYILRKKNISPKKRAPRNAKNKRGKASYPMDIGDEFEVEIFDVAPNGEGVAKIKGYPTFIKNAKLNDRVKIKVTALIDGAVDAEIVT